jgi:hypothetical protein
MHPDRPEQETSAKPALSVTSLPLADAALLLSRAGGSAVTVALLEADVARGAPLNADRTLNLVHYAAWLVTVVKEAAHAD